MRPGEPPTTIIGASAMARTGVTARPGERPDSGSGVALLLQPDGDGVPASEIRGLPWSAPAPMRAAGSEFAHPSSGSGVNVHVYGDLDVVEQDWKTFERYADRTEFQTFDRLAAWQGSIGARRGTIPAIVLGRDGDGQLLFMLQFAIETGGWVRRLTWLGWQLCEHNAPLLAEHFSDRMSAERFALAWSDVIELLHANPRLRFDLIDLQKMPESIGAQRNPFLDLRVLAHPSVAGARRSRRDRNFMTGDESHKGDGCDCDLQRYDHLAPVTAKGWLLAAMTMPYRRAKRVIEQSPSLWRIFCNTRALARSLIPH